MKKLLNSSWKTTLIGLGLAAIPISRQVLDVLETGQQPDWPQVAFGLGLALLGYFTRDKNK